MNTNNKDVKVRMTLVSLGIICVLLLLFFGVICWAGWKMIDQKETMKNYGKEMMHLGNQTEYMNNENIELENEAVELNRQTEQFNWTIHVILTFDTFPVNDYCPDKKCLRCSNGWMFSNGSCYLFNEDDILIWEESRQYCKNRSADLVVVDSLKEQEFLMKQFTKPWYWLGLQKKCNDWVWIDGHIDTLGYWNYPYITSGSYAEMSTYMPITESWYQMSSTETSYTICEKEV